MQHDSVIAFTMRSGAVKGRLNVTLAMLHVNTSSDAVDAMEHG
jgi:hypothetical protein